MISEKVREQIKEAMKAKEAERLSVLKMLLSELNNAKIDSKGELSEEDEMKVVQKEAKKRKDAIEAYEKAGQPDRAKAEEFELEVLKEYLPEEMSDEELNKIVDETVSGMGDVGMQDMGRVMGAVMGKVQGKADGNRVSAMVKSKLSS